jgi:hypothetical protein
MIRSEIDGPASYCAGLAARDRVQVLAVLANGSIDFITFSRFDGRSPSDIFGCDTSSAFALLVTKQGKSESSRYSWLASYGSSSWRLAKNNNKFRTIFREEDETPKCLGEKP